LVLVEAKKAYSIANPFSSSVNTMHKSMCNFSYKHEIKKLLSTKVRLGLHS